MDILIKKACNVARNIEFGKTLDQIQQSLSRYSDPRSSIGSTITPVKSADKLIFSTKLTNADREYLRKNKECFNCRRINVDHISTNYDSCVSRTRTNFEVGITCDCK